MFTEQEVYDMLSLLFTAALRNVQPEVGWTLEHGAAPLSQVIQQLLKQNLSEISPTVRTILGAHYECIS